MSATHTEPSDVDAAFNRALDDDPKDWQCRLVYADWLHDEGRLYDEMAQRRIVEWKWIPKHKASFPSDYKLAWYWREPSGKRALRAWDAMRNELVYDNGGNQLIIFGWTRADAEKILASALRYLHAEVLGLPPLEQP